MASAALAPPDADQAVDFEARNEAIGLLVNLGGMPTRKVANLFGLSHRHARRVARDEYRRANRIEPIVADGELLPSPSSAGLTAKEVATMLRELAVDPYASAEDREQAEAWVTSYTEAAGIELVRPRSAPTRPNRFDGVAYRPRSSA